MVFYNIQTPPENITAIPDLQLEQISPSWKKKAMVVYMLIALFLYLVPIVLNLASEQIDIPWVYLIALSVPMIILILTWIFVTLGYKRRGFALRTHDFVVQSGVILHQTTVIALERIQHVTVTQGPVDRLFGLSSLQVFTAGGSSSDVVVPGLPTQRAEELRDALIKAVSQIND